MKYKKVYYKILSFVLFLCTMFSYIPRVNANTTNNYNYAEALQLSLYFYDANKCGSGITNAAITWRGDCHTYDAKLSLDTQNTNLPQDSINKYKNILDPDGDGKIDVSGGFHDAGDHIKCAQTNGFSLATLNLGLYEFRDSYTDTETLNHMEEILKHFCDYIMKCTYINENGEVIAFCYQVGDANDHNYWEAPEGQTIKRPAFFAYENNPGTEQAATAVNLKDTDNEYAKKCLEYAKALYNFGMKYKGSTSYHNGYFYASTNGYDDDIAWAQVWMYLATGEQTYLEQARNANINDGWIHSWDKVWGGYVALMADITKDEKYISILSQTIDNLMNSYRTPAGYICIGDWGSARNNSAWQIYALIYTKITNNTKYLPECEKQMQYILGNNPMQRSYLIGYSDNYAKHPHHRGISMQKSQGELVGALVGGPNSSDYHNDSQDDYQQNEVALDYNAPFVTAAAGLYSLVGKSQGNIPVTIHRTEINSNYYNDSKLPEDDTTVSTNYKIKDNKIYAIPRNTTVSIFIANINTQLSIQVYDKNNEEVGQEELIKTNMKVKIGDKTYILIVLGDLDGNGKVTITDLVKANLYNVGLIELSKIEQIATDINCNNKITITDIVNINLIVVGLK